MDAVAVERVAVTLGGAEHALAVLSFVDRRPRKAARKQWVLVRGLERVLYGVRDGGRSTGAFGAHLSKCTMRDAVLVAEKSRVEDGTLTSGECELLLDEMRHLRLQQQHRACRQAQLSGKHYGS